MAAGPQGAHHAEQDDAAPLGDAARQLAPAQRARHGQAGRHPGAAPRPPGPHVHPQCPGCPQTGQPACLLRCCCRCHRCCLLVLLCCLCQSSCQASWSFTSPSPQDQVLMVSFLLLLPLLLLHLLHVGSSECPWHHKKGQAANLVLITLVCCTCLCCSCKHEHVQSSMALSSCIACRVICRVYCIPACLRAFCCTTSPDLLCSGGGLSEGCLAP